MKFVIEKNIPMPEVIGGRKSKYPFAQMEIGDSFLAITRSAVLAASQYGKRKNMVFFFPQVRRWLPDLARCLRAKL